MSDFTFISGGVTIPADTYPITSSQDIADTLTVSTPIVITAASVPTMLTNNGLALNTGSQFLVPAITQLYDTATNALDFTDLALGDIVRFRVDIVLTTVTNNTDVSLGLSAGIGGATPFTLPFYTRTIKKFGVTRIVADSYLLMRTTSTLLNPAKFYIATDGVGTDTCVVNGWSLSHTPRFLK